MTRAMLNPAPPKIAPSMALSPGSQKAFSQLIQRRVGCDRTSGRPRYSHIRLKPVRVEHAPAPLRLAVVNS